MRIGHGFDIHRLALGEKLILGGVHIPYEKGTEAHSDGDVVLHALCDALLGAAALGDIGTHFPDDDARFKSIDSRRLLKQVFDLLTEKKWVIANIDITILAQRPKMAPYIGQMKEHIMADLALCTDQVNIKATTTEGLGEIGQGKGIAVHAVTLLT